MAAKGSILKSEITQKLLDIFPGSFLYNDGKELRIPGIENSEQLQIKVTLTCAKTNVESGNSDFMPQESSSINDTSTPSAPAQPSEEEKQTIADLVARLGLA